MSDTKSDLISDPNHRVLVKVRPGQVVRRESVALTSGQMLRVRASEARRMIDAGTVERV